IPPYLPSTVVNTTLRLQALREAMSSVNVSAYIIPGTDAHLSEYIAPRDARMAFMTGFTGSAGTAVVTLNKAVLWTDSRYWVQAERQMDCNWELEKDVSISSIADWLIREVSDTDNIGFDPFLFSIRKASLIVFSHLAPTHTRLTERTWQMKVEHIRTQMTDNPYKPTAVLLSALDETAWLFNLRGSDVPYNPFFYSYTLLTLNEIWLFVHKDRVTEDLKLYLNSTCFPLAHCVQLLEYEQVRVMLKNYMTTSGVKVWIGTEYTNYALYELITPEKLLTSAYSPVLTTKAVKDETEQRILRDAHVRDAVAVIQLLMWLEKVVPEGKETEMTAAYYVNECRSKQKDSRGPSFETISASGPNAALAHYSPSNATSRKLTVDEMYLLFHMSILIISNQFSDLHHSLTPKEAFTRVLMGNIEISRTIFPSGTKGVNMEMLGRRALWEVGLNYGHGTGHGVGNYFGVHECTIALLIVVSLPEPGYYKENDFGIRIEDVVVIVPAHTKYGHNYLTFETVSLVPYDRKLIDTSLMSPQQLQWLDNYYLTIRELMGDELDRQGLTEEKTWMLKHTVPFQSATASAAVSSLSLTLTALATALLHILL
uniref:Uncharacterized protein n=1 Tax=Oncorhynchus tshawytscha TaxID=74940 RepID=A0AAZ3QGS9_ONCTS